MHVLTGCGLFLSCMYSLDVDSSCHTGKLAIVCKTIVEVLIIRTISTYGNDCIRVYVLVHIIIVAYLHMRMHRCVSNALYHTL